MTHRILRRYQDALEHSKILSPTGPFRLLDMQRLTDGTLQLVFNLAHKCLQDHAVRCRCQVRLLTLRMINPCAPSSLPVRRLRRLVHRRWHTLPQCYLRCGAPNLDEQSVKGTSGNQLTHAEQTPRSQFDRTAQHARGKLHAPSRWVRAHVAALVGAPYPSSVPPSGEPNSCHCFQADACSCIEMACTLAVRRFAR